MSEEYLLSSVDISALGTLKPSQAPSVPPVRPAKAKFTLAPAAEYTLRITTPVTNETLSKSKTDNLNFKFDAEIVEGPFASAKVRYQNASAATYTQDGVEQSRLGNLVAALGGSFPGVGEDGSPAPQVAALEAVVGNTFRGYVTWKAEDRKFGSGIKVTGQKNFPIDPATGSSQSYIEIPGQLDDQGRPARVWANLEISNYVPATR